MAIRNWLLAGIASLMLDGDNLSPPYTAEMLQKIDSFLGHSYTYGNRLKGGTIYSDEWSPTIEERYYDNMLHPDGRLNSVYLIHELGTPFFMVRIFHDRNDNGTVDGDELGFEMVNHDRNIATAEYIRLVWEENAFRWHIVAVGKDDKDPGNKRRFRAADNMFRKIVHQTKFYEYVIGR